MGGREFAEKAIELVDDYVCNHIMKKQGYPDASWETYIVWQCKILQNNKAMLSTTLEDGRYYEVTYNGDKKEFYVDAYTKEKNEVYQA